MEYRLFDEAYYASQFKDFSGDALQHFLTTGWRQNYNPHPLFDTKRYREWYPDVEQSGTDPLTHFERHGHNGFKPHLLFNSMVYLASYPEAAGHNPLVHFLQDGWRKQYNPHPYFDTAFYLRLNHDVRSADANPLIHYIMYGHKEGRRPHPLFDGEEYKRANELDADTNPLEHFLKDGQQPLSKAGNYLTTDEFQDFCKQFAERWKVRPEVSPHDMTMGYHVYHRDYAKDRSLAIKYYFDDGRESARRLLALLPTLTGRQHLLEFASGYGRVARHWKHVTDAAVTACDIHPQAVSFLKDTLGIPAFQSATSPDDFNIPGKYDVIFCLSFFSHMPEATWGKWLKTLFNKLNPGGFLVITTHGETCMQKRGIEMAPGTLYFSEETEQYDLDTKDYGYAAVDRAFVEAQISKVPSAKLARFEKDYYWRIQDTYVIQKMT